MPRKQKKYHFIYRTTNLLNENFYVGMHSTDDLEDGYVGSGKRLRYSVTKYGLENHKFEILEFLTSREELKKREAEIVNEELLSDPLCMNLKFGGEGGWDTKNIDVKSRNAKCLARFHEKIKNDTDFTQTVRKKQSKKTSSGWNSGKYDIHYGNSYWKGKRHSEETKQKMRKSRNVGENNSQFGTCWINDGFEAKKVKKEDLQSWLDKGWRKGRKLPG